MTTKLLRIRTWLRTRMPDGTQYTWERPECTLPERRTVTELRRECRRRFPHYEIENIPDGCRTTPRRGHGNGELYQEVTIIEGE